MGSKFAFAWVFSLLSLLVWVTVADHEGKPKFFNVMEYGAVADGATDNSEAFIKAWKDACNWEGRARVWIPRGTFMVNSVTFKGRCKGRMAFVIKGILKAPTDPTKFKTEEWIHFRYVDNLTVSGGGTLDGQGQVAWAFNDCSKNSKCQALPATLRLDFVRNSRVHNLRSVNSKSVHLVIFGCQNMNVSKIRLSAPGDSPNTDGIKIGSSQSIRISRARISTGDDCIAMLSGTKKVHISEVVCGPGHGISVGSLGQYGDEEGVSGVVVKNCTFRGTSNGVRIKTWASPAVSEAANFLYENIFMDHVLYPIVIDQEYCPHRASCYQQPSRVQISNVTYRNIWGSSDSKVPVTLRCSQSRPCRNVLLEDINLAYSGNEGRAAALCSHVNGLSLGELNPPSCL